MNTEPFSLDATHLAQSVAAGQLSATEALEHSLAETQRLNPTLNAVCHVNEAHGREQAAALDGELAACASSEQRQALLRARPFLGVPSLLKDLSTPALGLPSTMGSRLFGQVKWELDGSLVQRYRQSGMVLFGRSTSPEMGISPSTEAVAYGGPTRNPWNTAHSAGGSSGGAASAVASRMVLVANASDGAGSIRIPGSCCGLVGLKPTRGLMPMGPLAGEGWGGFATDHVVTLSVRDCAAVMDATAGGDLGQPYAAPQRPASYLAQLDQAQPKRIALCDTFFEGDAVHPEVHATLMRVAQQLRELGHTVELARPPVGTLEVLEPMVHIIAAGTANAVDNFLQRRGRGLADDELEPITRSAVEVGRRLTAAGYVGHLARVHAYTRRMAAFLQSWDMLLTPVLAEPPRPVGQVTMSGPDFLDYRIGPQGLWRYSPFTPLTNATGQPSISVPAGLSSQGLPIGVMLASRFGDDLSLLQVAQQLQQQTPRQGWALDR